MQPPLLTQRQRRLSVAVFFALLCLLAGLMRIPTASASGLPPTANADSYTTAEDTALTITAPGVLGNDTDPELDPLTAVLVAGPTSGTLALSGNGSFTYTPNANFNGTDSFTYQASDGTGFSNTATVTLTVTAVNDPPVATADAYGTRKNTALTVSAPGVLSNDTDTEGQALSAVLVAGPTNGTLTLNPDGSFTYTPAVGFSGADSFSYRASDGTDQSAVVTVSLQVGDTTTLTTAIEGQGTLAVSPAGNTYDTGTVVTLTAQAAPGALFVGWVVDSTPAGWAPTLTITMDRDHAVTARFADVSDFSDLPAGSPAYVAVRELAARGIIRGYGDGRFGTDDPLLRAQVAALVARSMDWEFEDWGNPFTDQGMVDDNLWRNVGTLNHYNVARGFGDGTYRPIETVNYAQFISLITRSMVAKGYWTMQPDDASRFQSVGNSGHRQDLITYQFYVGSFPELTENSSAQAWFSPASRSWTASALWAAINQYQRVDRTP
jgi:VCBS repeat-containing protein